MNNRVASIEQNIGLIQNLLGSLEKRIDTYDNTRPCAAGTQTEGGEMKSSETQTYMTKNITERGVQVAATTTSTLSQTDKTVSKGDLLVQQLSQRVLPLLASIQPSWVVEAGQSNVIDGAQTQAALTNIVNKTFQTADVVACIEACVRIVVATYSIDDSDDEESEVTEYETDSDAATPTQNGMNLYYKVRH
jgi:hypothetical protein